MAKINTDEIEAEIESQLKTVRYDIRELTIEYYVNKYSQGLEEEKNELYVPDYQREFVWDEVRQSRFIETLFLGLPVPLLFVAEMEGSFRFEIVDGSQRIRTLDAFINGGLKLKGLKRLRSMIGVGFQDLLETRQRKFRNLPMRMIVLSSLATEEARTEMFDRINTSSVTLLPMEIRRGVYRGVFTDFIVQKASESFFKSLMPMYPQMEKRREEEEMLLRFFAFRETFPNFTFKTRDGKKVSLKDEGVARYLDLYLDDMNARDDIAEKFPDMERQISDVLSLVSSVFPNQGFAKKCGVRGVSKPYFEAIAIGVSLALQEGPINPDSTIRDTLSFDRSNTDFTNLFTDRYHTHSPAKLARRICYVRDVFLRKK